MVRLNTHREIEKLIRSKSNGTLFVISDFVGLGSIYAVRKALSRLVADGTLVRELRGIYKKPNYNAFIKEDIMSTPKEIAYAYARAYGWKIAPSGNTALNELGISTQVPNVNAFISDGPYRTIVLANKTKIRFKNVPSSEITNISYEAALIIEAIKYLKKENITVAVLDNLRNRFTEDELQVIKSDSKVARSWVYEQILKL